MASRRAATYPIVGKTALITGAARGIGAELARRLHERGANVALIGLEPDRLAQNATALGEQRAFWVEADVTDPAALERAVAATVERFGGIDIAVANAGLAYVGTLTGMPAEQIERVLAVNLLGVWQTDRAVAEEVGRRGGYILNIASLAAILHAPLMGAYTTAKAGVDALTDALRAELAPGGVAVGAAYFGYLDTDIVRGAYSHPAAQRANRRVPAVIRQPASVSKAITAVLHGIEARTPRIYYPGWVRLAYLLRGPLQPLSEAVMARDRASLAEAIAAAERESATPEDPKLGIAARALRGNR